MFQRARGLDALEGLAAFPLERVVEVHIAGGALRHTRDGLPFIEDTHGVDVLEDTWRIFERVVAGAVNLRAVVFECERNGHATVAPGFARIEQTLAAAAAGCMR
jgi:uncharacterized protein (UPF0276 family)